MVKGKMVMMHLGMAKREDFGRPKIRHLHKVRKVRELVVLKFAERSDRP